jgi:hypothetical protein
MIAPQPASFYLSGVRVGHPAPAMTTIWRFTPLLSVGHPGEDAGHALSVRVSYLFAHRLTYTSANVGGMPGTQ